MTTEHVSTREEEIYWALLDEKWWELSEAPRTVIKEADTVAYLMYMVSSYCFQDEEYEEATEKMRLAAAELTDYDCELLTNLWCSALAAAASVDPRDFETYAGFRVYPGTLHLYYRMWSSMVETALQESPISEIRRSK